MAWRLYLPHEWADGATRRAKAGVPEEVAFATKTAIALAQIEHLLAQGAPKHCVLADAGYGTETALRERLRELGLPYVVGVTRQANVWAPGHEPIVPEPRQGRGGQFTRLQLGSADDPLHRPQSVKDVAIELPPLEWYRVSWREGVDHEFAAAYRRRPVQDAAPMSVLPARKRRTTLVTQYDWADVGTGSKDETARAAGVPAAPIPGVLRCCWASTSSIRPTPRPPMVCAGSSCTWSTTARRRSRSTPRSQRHVGADLA